MGVQKRKAGTGLGHEMSEGRNSAVRNQDHPHYSLAMDLPVFCLNPKNLSKDDVTNVGIICLAWEPQDKTAFGLYCDYCSLL